MSTTKTPRVRHFLADQLQVRAEDALPEGIAGRVTGVALTYEVVDTYGTIFARGSAKRSVDSKVKARKVPLLMDHERLTGAHVGVVTMMQDVGDALMMTADLFDTPAGRSALEYVKAVIAAGATTGFSIGFVPRRSEMVTVDGKIAERFLEIELREVSITPMPAVPGADVLGARVDDAPSEPVRSDVELLTLAARAALQALPVDERAAVLALFAVPAPITSAASDPAATRASGTASAPDGDPLEVTLAVPKATMDQRLAAVRSTFSL